MFSVTINKLSLCFCLFLLCKLFFLHNNAFANNASYITLSGQMARKQQLEVTANNVANASTVGFEQDAILFRHVDKKQKKDRHDSFVWSETTYRTGEQGGLKVTNRPLDVAIATEERYFKVRTPRGDRYTLDGSMLINNQNVLVNLNGYPYLSIENQVIELPETFNSINIVRDGTIFINEGEIEENQIATLGVFEFDSIDPIIKEGGNLYAIKGEALPSEDYTIIPGALRASNVNPTLAMTQMVELQRAYSLTTDLMTNVNELESSSIQKLTK